jgi:hypothetical protein
MFSPMLRFASRPYAGRGEYSPRIFHEQRLNVVEHDIGLQVGKRVDFPHDAFTIDQEHLQHMMQSSGRATALVHFNADVLTEIFQDGEKR